MPSPKISPFQRDVTYLIKAILGRAGGRYLKGRAIYFYKSFDNLQREISNHVFLNTTNTTSASATAATAAATDAVAATTIAAATAATAPRPSSSPPPPPPPPPSTTTIT